MILIRSCSGHDELEACVQLQIETWGYDESDIIPRKAFLVGQKIGGQVIGAFDTDLPGAGAERHTGVDGWIRHVFAGREDRRNSADGNHSPTSTPTCLPYVIAIVIAGLGAQLKLEQRREALSRGIRLMEWTFDPLEIKNAHLNIHKLGAVVRSYLVNFYGVSSSRLQGWAPNRSPCCRVVPRLRARQSGRWKGRIQPRSKSKIALPSQPPSTVEGLSPGSGSSISVAG